MRPELKEELENTKWRYLRENDNRYFSVSRNTSLKDYLNAIFPYEEWIYNKTIPSDLQEKRGSKKSRRFMPDARCESLSLIVEFDGVPHYQGIKNVINDPIRDEYLISLGYRVVRIPYYIQLSRINIKHLFGVDMGEEMCPLKYSFFDSDEDGLGIAPGSMCGLGVERFLQEFMHLPVVTKNEIVADLRLVATSHPLDWVVPREYQGKLLKEW